MRALTSSTPVTNAWTGVLVLIVWWTTVVVPDQFDDFRVRDLDPVEVVVLMVATVGLLFRHRSALLTLALTVGADFASVVLDLEGHGYHYAGLFGVFCVAMRYRLRTSLALVSASMGLVYLAEVQQAGGRWLAFAPTWVVLSTALAFSFGQVRYLREQLLQSLEERVISAEAAQDAVARSRVAEDRLQTARELHDVVGHRIAVVHLRAAVAVRALDDDPEATRQALVDIDDAAKAVLSDIDHLLAELRTGDGPPQLEQRLGRMDEFLDGFRRYGLVIREDLEADLDRELETLPAEVAATTRQVLVETLTNAYKHGGVNPSAHLRIRQSTDQLEVTVRNPNPTGPVQVSKRSGWGLHGLRERVADLGGTMRVTQEPDFVVDVFLPLGPRTAGRTPAGSGSRT